MTQLHRLYVQANIAQSAPLALLREAEAVSEELTLIYVSVLPTRDQQGYEVIVGRQEWRFTYWSKRQGEGEFVLSPEQLAKNFATLLAMEIV